ncbi:MAG: trigger factor [Eubacteriales bacterium]
MRKLALFLALALLVTLTACAKTSLEDEVLSGAATTSVKSTTAAPETTASSAAQESGDEDAGFSFSPSDGLTEAGFFEGVDALSYVTLPEYVGIPLPADVHTPTDDAIQAEIDKLMENFQTNEHITDPSRKIADGDTVNVDFVGSIDGVEFEGGSTGGAGTDITIGTTMMIDDFVEQLVGHAPGDTFDIEVTFPEDYGKEELNGRDAVFAITVNYIAGDPVIPELTDGFVAENLAAYYGWTTVDELREGLKTSLADSNITSYLQNYLSENAEVTEVPQSMVDYQINTMLDYYNSYASIYGMTLDEFIVQAAGAENREALIEENREGLEYYARFYLILQAVAEDAGIAADDAAVSEYFAENMAGASVDDYIADYGEPYIRFVVLSERIVSYLRDNAVRQ